MKTMSGDCPHCGHDRFFKHLRKDWICEECGYGQHPLAVPTERCPTCGNDAEPTEIGSSTHVCSTCDTEFEACPTCGARAEA
jgi:rubrerythrin